MTEQSQGTPRDPSDSSDSTIMHGLSQKQVEQLFGEQGQFDSLNDAWDVLWQKAQYAAQWLSSYWTADIPEEVIAARKKEEKRVADFHAELQIEDPETYRELVAWNENTLQEQAQDESIVKDWHPLAGYVMTATSLPNFNERYQLSQDVYKSVCEAARLSVADGSDDDKSMVEYAIAVLEEYGEANWSSNNKEGAITRVKFPAVIQRYLGRAAFYPSGERLF
ncbi:MAG: hypothetical protein WAO28_02615 [Candidatus Microsaccharimonas sp.]